ncbi:pyridoxal phosphate-dependent transferase [Dissophora ornata]|nr:pyridoxal phosphate-dependent transferase [Dissophora ornata]
MDPEIALAQWARMNKKNPKDFIKSIQDDIISSPIIHDPPFGKKKPTHADWFTSAKSLQTFEKIIVEAVLPSYANSYDMHPMKMNTAAATTWTARSTSAALHNSRTTIARCLNAHTTKGHQHEATVIFCGDDANSSILKVRDAFRLADEALWMRWAIAKQKQRIIQAQPTTHFTDALSDLPAQHRPVVFISIQEHESNILPWRESVADVVVIEETDGHVLNLRQLEEELVLYRDRPLKVGSFSAGSSLTGVLNDTVAIAEILHRHDAFAFFDYSGVGAYTPVDMNPRPSNSYTMMRDSLAYKDGIFLAPQKLLGGPGSSGVLAARLDVFLWAEQHGFTEMRGKIPATRDTCKYTNNLIALEEAGNLNVLASIRAGLVFRLQQIMNPRLILGKEHWRASQVYHRLLTPDNNITVLGSHKQDRVAVFCVSVSVPLLSAPDNMLQIHHALLSMIMNDFFGIEMSSGTMGTGLYASYLLSHDGTKDAAFWSRFSGTNNTGNNGEQWVHNRSATQGLRMQRQEVCRQQNLLPPILRPGFVRFSTPNFQRDKDVDFVLQSLEWIAQYGFLLIPFYQLNVESGTWSIREAVRHAVCRSINTKRLNREHRSDYIQVATDCIYALRKLFHQPQRRPQQKQQQEQEREWNKGDQETVSKEPPPPSTAFVGDTTVISVPMGMFHSLNQAKSSFRNLFSSATQLSLSPILTPMKKTPKLDFRVTLTDAWSSSPSFRPSSYPHQHQYHRSCSSRTRSSSFPASSGAVSAVGNGFQDGSHSSFPWNGQGLKSPQIRNNLFDESQILSGNRSCIKLSIEDSSELASVDQSIKSSPNATNTRTHNFSIQRQKQPTKKKQPQQRKLQKWPFVSDTTVQNALDELSWEGLEAETDSVENNSTLAKQSRWFVTPVEVAKLYVSSSSSNCDASKKGSSAFSSPTPPFFPPCVAKREKRMNRSAMDG